MTRTVRIKRGSWDVLFFHSTMARLHKYHVIRTGRRNQFLGWLILLHWLRSLGHFSWQLVTLSPCMVLHKKQQSCHMIACLAQSVKRENVQLHVILWNYTINELDTIYIFNGALHNIRIREIFSPRDTRTLNTVDLTSFSIHTDKHFQCITGK